MKPRLYLCEKLWVCKLRGTRNGYGYAPKQAYREWAHLNGWAK
jgi:hypothetical protein